MVYFSSFVHQAVATNSVFALRALLLGKSLICGIAMDAESVTESQTGASISEWVNLAMQETNPAEETTPTAKRPSCIHVCCSACR